MFSRVHYGINSNFAQWNGSNLTFGDGTNGYTPRVSVDTVGHEWSHGVIQYTANLMNSGESGTANESFSDIFGTMIEFHSGVYNRPPNYLLGEDYGTPVRSMANPPAYGDPDHYNNRRYPGYCSPSGTNDRCGIHHNSGIMNKAFYLLAEGGTQNGVTVRGVGRDRAERIFYTASVRFLTPGINLHNVCIATLDSARLLYGYQDQGTRDSVKQAWAAVGIPENIIDESWFFVQQQCSDLLNRYPDQGGWNYWANRINQTCGPANPTSQACIDPMRLSVALAFFYSSEYITQNQALSSANRYSTDPNVEHAYNAAFVDQCYRRYFHRQPDTGGFNYWVNWLDSRRPNNDGDYDTIINAFYSLEYRLKFCCEG